MSENGKNVPLIVCDFHTKYKVRGTHLVFQKMRFQGFISEILRVVGTWKKSSLSSSLRLSFYINVVLLINFPEQFELCFTSNIREVIKFYNLGDKTFETDFRIITKTKQLIKKISWIFWLSPWFQLLFLVTHLTKESLFGWFKSHSP